jgi:hypothetical protein
MASKNQADDLTYKIWIYIECQPGEEGDSFDIGDPDCLGYFDLEEAQMVVESIVEKYTQPGYDIPLADQCMMTVADVLAMANEEN